MGICLWCCEIAAPLPRCIATLLAWLPWQRFHMHRTDAPHVLSSPCSCIPCSRISQQVTTLVLLLRIAIATEFCMVRELKRIPFRMCAAVKSFDTCHDSEASQADTADWPPYRTLHF